MYTTFSLPSEGGWDICIQATEGASMCLSRENSSTGTTGEPLHLRSSPSDVCGTCSGTREGAILFQPLPLPQPQSLPPHLPIPLPLPILIQIPIQTLLPTLILLLTPNLKLNPRLKPNTSSTSYTNRGKLKAACQSLIAPLCPLLA